MKKFFKKSISAILSISLLMSLSNTNTFASNRTKVVKNGGVKSSVEIGQKLKSFYKDHPTACKTTIAVGSVGAFCVGAPILAYTAYKGTYTIWRELYIKDIRTTVDGYSKKEVKEKLQEQIKKYKEIGKGVFTIDDKLVKKCDKKYLLITLIKLNYLFEKYSGFTNDLIAYKKETNTTFDLRTLNSKDDGFLLSIMAEQRTECNLCGFAVKPKNYKDILSLAKKSVKKGFWSPRSMDELLESIITHEFGHAMAFLYLTRKAGVKNVPKVRGLSFSELIKLELDGEFSHINKGIVKMVNSITQTENFANAPLISKYGMSNISEYFAEVFAHLECSEKDKVNDLGKRAEKFIIDEMKYLNPENSKFYNVAS